MAKLDQEMKKVREKYSDDLWLIVFRIEIEKDGERKVKMSKAVHQDLIFILVRMKI